MAEPAFMPSLESKVPVPSEPPVSDAVAILEKLTCVGRETAVVLAREVLYCDFRDRRSRAAFAGLTPCPYSSGRLQHEQGISKRSRRITIVAVARRLLIALWRYAKLRVILIRTLLWMSLSSS